jgi:sugar lactone lactonase YvrE
VQRIFGEPVTDVRYDHAEGPAWDGVTGSLLWLDQHVGDVLLGEWNPAAGTLTPTRSFAVGTSIGAAVPAREPTDGWLLAAGRGFARLGTDGAVQRLAEPEEGTPGRIRMNDGKCDAQGRFWAGSMSEDGVQGAATLYRLDPDLTLTAVLRGVTISNGLAWSADGGTLFHADTPTQRIDAFTVTGDGTLRDRRTVVHLPDGVGLPDGMCIDGEGALWVAMWGGHAVRRYSPAGELLAVVEVDAAQVISCCFGGPQLDTLFITTSQEGLDDAARAADPQSGRLFAAAVGVCGEPAARFG